MLSSSADMAEFMAKIRNRSYLEVVYLADREATDAERRTLQGRPRNELESDTYRRYALELKDFLLFVRHGVKTSTVRNLDLQDFQDIRFRESHHPGH